MQSDGNITHDKGSAQHREARGRTIGWAPGARGELSSQPPAASPAAASSPPPSSPSPNPGAGGMRNPDGLPVALAGDPPPDRLPDRGLDKGVPDRNPPDMPHGCACEEAMSGVDMVRSMRSPAGSGPGLYPGVPGAQPPAAPPSWPRCAAAGQLPASPYRAPQGQSQSQQLIVLASNAINCV